ncbi:hypothetical protein TrVE_jg11398, partial [Triparma verrucosa]
MADKHVHPPPSIEGLQAELKAAVSALEAEREANKSLSAKLMEKEKAVAQFERVVAQINGDKQLQARRRNLDETYASPLDRDNPAVKKLGDVLSKSITTTTCSFNVNIHEEPAAFFEALVGDQLREGTLLLFQKVVAEDVVYWSFMAGGNKSCDLLLIMEKEDKDGDEIVIRASSIDEE